MKDQILPAQVAPTENPPAKGLDMQEAANALASVETLATAAPTGLNLSMDYFEFKNFFGQEKRFLLLGFVWRDVFNAQKNETKSMEHAVFADAERKVWVNCAAKFVDSVKRLPQYAQFSAKFVGTKTTKSGGNMQLFEVFQLRPV
jgi:hypothetical protein